LCGDQGCGSLFACTWDCRPQISLHPWHSALRQQKKQSRLIGFFWACVRRRYIQENPALGLSKIKVIQIPTDYFPPEEFDRIIEATYSVCDNRGGFIDVEANRIRLRTVTLLMR
jgi:hypothetical protein